MIKIDMSWYRSLQNFVFMPDGSLLWTSDRSTPFEKLRRVKIRRNRKKGESFFYLLPSMGHTSIGVDIPFHGQWLTLENNELVRDIGTHRDVYDLNFKFLRKDTPQHLTPQEIRGLPGMKGLLIQGVDYYKGCIYVAAGRVGKGLITITKHDRTTKELLNKFRISYRHKWYNRYWEAEGIRVHPDTGEVWFGVAFKSWFFTYSNYRDVVEI